MNTPNFTSQKTLASALTSNFQVKKKQFIICVVVVFIAALLWKLFAPQYRYLQIINGQTINTIKVEIADTPFKQTMGLMYRKSLPKDQGMLFVFNNSQRRFFWMKNTFISLDIVWIDEDLNITGVRSNAQPCKKDTICKTYASDGIVKYVLEINAGMTRDFGISSNTKLVLN